MAGQANLRVRLDRTALPRSVEKSPNGHLERELNIKGVTLLGLPDSSISFTQGKQSS